VDIGISIAAINTSLADIGTPVEGIGAAAIEVVIIIDESDLILFITLRNL
jgi:hypothetical protein